MSHDGPGQGGGRGGTGPTEQLPVGVVEVKGVNGVDGVLLKAPQVLVEAATAALTVQATLVVVSVAMVMTMVVATVKVSGWDPLCNMDHVGAALPSQGGLAAGRGCRLAVGATVATRCHPLHRSDPDGSNSLWVGVEGWRKGDGGREGQIGINRVGVVAHWYVGIIEIRIVGYQVRVLEVVGVVGVQWV